MATLVHLSAQHAHFRAQLRELRELADRLDTLEPAEVRPRLQSVISHLRTGLVPQLRAEEAVTEPVLVDVTGSDLSAAYPRIVRDQIGHLVDELTQRAAGIGDVASSAEVRAIRRLLYTLDALTTVLLRFVDEVVLPTLSEALGKYDAGAVSDAIHAAEDATTPNLPQQRTGD